jgi:hypothetical protein
VLIWDGSYSIQQGGDHRPAPGAVHRARPARRWRPGDWRAESADAATQAVAGRREGSDYGEVDMRRTLAIVGLVLAVLSTAASAAAVPPSWCWKGFCGQQCNATFIVAFEHIILHWYNTFIILVELNGPSWRHNDSNGKELYHKRY